MKNLLLLVSLTAALLLGGSLLSSFSVVPVPSKAPPPMVQQQQKRLQRRVHRLQHRLQQSTNKRQRQRIQHRLHRIQQQQDNTLPPAFFGILGLSAASLSFIFMFLFIYTWATLGNILALGITVAAFTGPTIIGLLSVVLAIVAIVFCAMHIRRSKKNPGQYGKKGFSIVGIIIASITLGFMIFIYFGYLIFLAITF